MAFSRESTDLEKLYLLIKDGNETQECKEVLQYSTNSHQEEPPSDMDSEILQRAIGSENEVVEGFQNIVRQKRTQTLNIKTIFRQVKYALVLIPLQAVLMYLLLTYMPTRGSLGLLLVIPIIFVVGIIVLIIWLIYLCCGKARWALNRSLKQASRYLDVCQISDVYVKNMLPNLGPEAEGVCHCMLAGSAGDGFGFFPVLSANVGIRNKLPPLTQDVDMNIFYDGLELQVSDLVTEGLAPGFCMIRLDNRSDFIPSFVHDCIVTHPTLPGLYLSGKLVSDKIGTYIPNDVEYNYPAITYTKVLDGPQGKYDFDVDMVWGIKIPIWPEVAKDWPTNSQRHLPHDLIEELVKKGCYVVHKHCTKDILQFPVPHMDHNLDWRFTFAEAESRLFKYHRNKEALKICYVILKFVLKVYSRNKKKKFPALKSYHLKTLFLRIAEQDKVLGFNMYDTKNNKDLGPLFMHLLSEYKMILEKKSLPHYFMPLVNILGQYSDEELKEGMEVIEWFQHKPLGAIAAFDHAWVSRSRMDLLMIIFSIVIFICFLLKFYFNYRQDNLMKESYQLFLEIVGEENMDLFNLDANKKKEFLQCLSIDVTDPKQQIKLCRLVLGLGLPRF